MCRSMVDIQSATAEIRRGKKKKHDKNIMYSSAMQGSHNNWSGFPFKQDPSSDHTGKDPSEDRNGNCRRTGRFDKVWN